LFTKELDIRNMDSVKLKQPYYESKITKKDLESFSDLISDSDSARFQLTQKQYKNDELINS
jgi:hypothetical protein